MQLRGQPNPDKLLIHTCLFNNVLHRDRALQFSDLCRLTCFLRKLGRGCYSCGSDSLIHSKLLFLGHLLSNWMNKALISSLLTNRSALYGFHTWIHWPSFWGFRTFVMPGKLMILSQHLQTRSEGSPSFQPCTLCSPARKKTTRRTGQNIRGTAPTSPLMKLSSQLSQLEGAIWSRELPRSSI